MAAAAAASSRQEAVARAALAATREGAAESLLKLIEQDRGAVLGARDEEGCTALNIAASKPTDDGLCFSFSSLGEMPAPRTRRTLVELLVDAGADVNARDVFGWTPLFTACVSWEPRLSGRGGLEFGHIGSLLRAGADPTIPSTRDCGAVQKQPDALKVTVLGREMQRRRVFITGARVLVGAGAQQQLHA
jgi:hypothetical protein